MCFLHEIPLVQVGSDCKNRLDGMDTTITVTCISTTHKHVPICSIHGKFLMQTCNSLKALFTHWTSCTVIIAQYFHSRLFSSGAFEKLWLPSLNKINSIKKVYELFKGVYIDGHSSPVLQTAIHRKSCSRMDFKNYPTMSKNWPMDFSDLPNYVQRNKCQISPPCKKISHSSCIKTSP